MSSDLGLIFNELDRLGELLRHANTQNLSQDDLALLYGKVQSLQNQLPPSLSTAGPSFQNHSELGLAICDSMPASIVFLDQQGVISWVNAAWIKISEENNLRPEHCGVGVNYLEVCKKAALHDKDAQAAYREVQKLLSGEAQQFSLEYPCHAPSEPRWFRLVGAPVRSRHVHGVLLMHMDVTQRVQAQRALMEAEHNYRQIFENAIEGIFRSSLDGRYLSANPALARLLEYDSPEELIRDIQDIGSQVYIDSHHRALFIEELATHGSVHGFETRFRTRKGNIRWIRTTAQLVRDDHGNSIHIQGTNFDVTSEKEAESKLEAEHSLLRTLLDHLPDYIYVKDAEGRYLLNNKANLQLLAAHHNSEVFGRTVFDIFPREIAEPYHRDDMQVISDGRSLLDKEEPIQGADGAKSWISTTKVPLRDSSGRILGLVGISRDITAQRNHELEIQKLAAFPRYSPNPVFSFNSKAELLYCNEAAFHMAKSLGLSQPSLLLPSNYRTFVGECLRGKKDPLRLETELQKKVISWAFFPIAEISEVHCYAVDVTERHLLEAQVRHSQKMESIGQLAGGVAHDFNNILTIIQGNASLISAIGDLPEGLSAAVTEIITASERAANLTRQLLTFSRKQAIQTTVLDLGEVVSTHTGLLRRILREDITLALSIPLHLPKVKADRGMIEQVIMNLVVNALDAMPTGGHLQISLSETSLPCSDKTDWNGPCIALEVSDTGVGIEPEVLPRIFEPFFTTKEVGKGTGLGLATAYGIIKQHHGNIRVSSLAGAGTTFTVLIPACAEVSSEAKYSARPDEVRGGTETILLVEDEPSLRSLMCHVLQTYGYKIIEAASGPKAEQAWNNNNGKIDLLLTDFIMPDGMTGGELMKLLQLQNPKLKVLFITGYSPDIAKFVDGSNAMHCLQKPFRPKTLANAVRKALDGKKPDVES
ncbi:MAG: PAS domain-containing protein [Verrucomicrobiales bacterium]